MKQLLFSTLVILFVIATGCKHSMPQPASPVITNNDTAKPYVPEPVDGFIGTFNGTTHSHTTVSQPGVSQTIDTTYSESVTIVKVSATKCNIILSQRSKDTIKLTYNTNNTFNVTGNYNSEIVNFQSTDSTYIETVTVSTGVLHKRIFRGKK